MVDDPPFRRTNGERQQHSDQQQFRRRPFPLGRLVVAPKPTTASHRISRVNGAGQASASKAPITSSSTKSSTSTSTSSSKLSCPSVFYMFMFRSRRNGLLKRLWRHAAGRTAGTGECDDLLLDGPSDQETTQAEHPQQQQVGWIKSAARALFKRMTEDQLAALLDIVEGTTTSAGCLLLDSDVVNGKECPQGTHSDDNVFILVVSSSGSCSVEGGLQLLCRIFRWPDMPVGAELKRMASVCRQPDPPPTPCSSSPSVCCNPYHWCRLSGKKKK